MGLMAARRNCGSYGAVFVGGSWPVPSQWSERVRVNSNLYVP